MSNYDTEPARFINYYRHCGVEWSDAWSCTCNDDCPKCGAEIEPYESDDIDPVDDTPYTGDAALKTYQYHDPKYDIEDDNGTRWIAAPSESAADEFANKQNWQRCGGEIFDQTKTRELLVTPGRGGIDTVIDGPKTLADELLTMLRDVTDAFNETIETHIYDRKVPDDAPEVELVAEARALIAKAEGKE